MRDKDPFSQFRYFINLMENRVHELGEQHGVENLAGPGDLQFFIYVKMKTKKFSSRTLNVSLRSQNL